MKRITLAVMLLTGMPATWATGGWYLYLSPVIEMGAGSAHPYKKILNDKPLSQWLQDAEYESALACETAKMDRARAEDRASRAIWAADMDDLKNGRDPSAHSPRRAAEQVHFFNYALYLGGRCIWSNDPRLGSTRRSTPSAASGWYLLVPPTDFHQMKVLKDKPFSGWSQQVAYDSESECETAKSDRSQKLQRAVDSPNWRTDVGTREEWRLYVLAQTQSRCVRSDDPGLREAQ